MPCEYLGSGGGPDLRTASDIHCLVHMLVHLQGRSRDHTVYKSVYTVAEKGWQRQ